MPGLIGADSLDALDALDALDGAAGAGADTPANTQNRGTGAGAGYRVHCPAVSGVDSVKPP